MSQEKHSKKDAGLASQGSASVGGSNASRGASVGNPNYHHEDTKIFQTVKLFTTLAGTGDDESGTGPDLNVQAMMRGGAGGSSGGFGGGQRSKLSNRDIILRWEKAFLTKLFQINHVLLSNQAVTVPLFHLVLILSFIQILFNIFYKVEIYNEFNTVSGLEGSLESSLIMNSTALSIGGATSNMTSAVAATPLKSYRIDQLFIFINFHIYVMQGASSTDQFLMLYGVLNGVFLAFLAFLFAISGRIFLQAKQEDVKDGTKVLIKSLSIMMCLFIFLLQIPMITLLLQGFLCDESATEEFALISLKCDSLEHKLLVIFSTVLLIVYFIFLVIESMLYFPNSFDNVVPWASFEKTLAFMRIVIKLVISCGFVFDKSGSNRAQINLVCLIFQSYILFKRNRSAIVFKTSIYYATILYETVQWWLYLVVSVSLLFGTDLTFTTTSMLFVCGFVFAGSLIYYQMQRKEQMVLQEEKFDKFSEPLDYIIYFYRFHKMIDLNSISGQIFLQGKLRKHILNCETPDCPCLQIIDFHDSFTKQSTLLKRFRVEEGAMQATQQMGQDASFQKMRTKQLLAVQKENEEGIGLIGGSDKNNETSELIVPNKEKLGDYSVAITQLESDMIKSTNKGLTKASDMTLPNQSSARKGGSNNKFSFIEFGGGGGAGQTMNDAELYSNLVAQKRKRSQLEQELLRSEEAPVDQATTERLWYLLYSLGLKEVLERFPKNVDLKIINAFVQKNKLNNEFKAIFEMMNCELCNPTYFERFIIFRQKIEVEQTLIKQQQKNIQRIGVIDVMQIYRYEKLYQQYQLYEYLTTYAALCFWRELLQKQINASVLQEKGSQISQFYEVIQDIAKKLLAIYPNEIKFYFGYGNFLLKIIHNEYDALENFRMASNVFAMKMAKKGNTMPINEQSRFGENSAAAVIIISATSTKIGTIIHTNEEVEEVLGYKRKDLIGRNITTIIPRPIAKVHDRLVQRYFETAKPTVIEIQRQLFGVMKEGYLQEVDLIVKVYPQVDEKIVFVGFVQKSDKFEDMEPPASEYERLEKNYIVTDEYGNITNVTEGLNSELGLHAKFFNYSDSIFQQMFNLKTICPTVFDNHIQDILENEGKVLTFDTTGILSNIELESLTSDEIAEVRTNTGRNDAYVQLKRLILPGYCHLCIYRIIMTKDLSTNGAQTNKVGSNFIQNSNANSLMFDEDSANTYENGESGHNMMSMGQFSASGSVSSATSQSFSFNRVIKDFKKALGERKTPKNLSLLNRIMIAIFLTTIALSSFNFTALRDQTLIAENSSRQNLMSESRTLKLIQLSSNFRSLLNIANGLEFDRYDGDALLPIDRFEYLSQLVQAQASDLLEIHQYLSQQRESTRSSFIKADMAETQMQSSLEYEEVELFRLDMSNMVTPYEQPFRVALVQYLNQIQALNNTDRSQIVIPFNLMSEKALETANFTVQNQTKSAQKMAFFLMVNGLRSLLSHATLSTEYFQTLYSERTNSTIFLVIMIVGTIITIGSFAVILYQVWMIDQNKAEILSLYALLEMNEINIVYQACSDHMTSLSRGSLFGQSEDPMASASIEGPNQMAGEGDQTTENAKPGQSPFFKGPLGGFNEEAFQLAGLDKQRRWSQMSEDEKEEIEQRIQVANRKKRRQADLRRKGGRRGGKFGAGNDILNVMIQRSQEQMRDIAYKEHATQFSKTKTAMTEDNPAGTHKSQKHSSKRKADKSNTMQGMQPSQNLRKAKMGQKGAAATGKKGAQEKKSGRKQVIIVEDEDWEDEKKHKSGRAGKKGGDDSHSRHEASMSQSGDDDNDSYGPEHDEEHVKRREERRQKKEAAMKEAELRNNNTEETQEQEERKMHFFKTIKSKNWGKLLANFVVAGIFVAYFVQLYVYNNVFMSDLLYIQQSLPLLLNRFRYTMLSYAYMRERILNNNTLNSFNEDPIYGFNIDSLYIDKSMENEQRITDFKIRYQSIASTLADIQSVADSQSFCASLIGNFSAANNTINSYLDDLILTSASSASGTLPYQRELDNQVALQQAAISGNIPVLRSLKLKGTDMNGLNYDRRTALHFAVRNGQLDTVKYLVQIGASINLQDRWGATPLNYAQGKKDIMSILVAIGAVYGNLYEDKETLTSVYSDNQLSEDDFRSFYASFNNDVQALKTLNGAGVLRIDVADQDGRTALLVAASQGSLEAVKYLVALKADSSLRDSRNRDSLAEAVREKRTTVVKFLKSIINQQVIRSYCSSFSQGLLNKGLQQAVGNFQKRFADLMIKLQSSHDYQDRLSYLQGTIAHDSLKVFFSTQELYYHIVIDEFITVIQSANDSLIQANMSTTQIVFMIFLAFQIVILFVIRGKLIQKMKDDIFQSRGILNLIPDSFFEQNRHKVEKLIKKLKD